MKIKQDDIINLVAKDLDIEADIIKKVERQIWLAIRNHLADLENNGGDLLINNFLTLEITERKIDFILKKKCSKKLTKTLTKIKQIKNER